MAQQSFDVKSLYTPLPTKTSIRVLRFQAHDRAPPLRFSLHVVDLEDKPSFRCLSYTWGDPLFHYYFEPPAPPARDRTIICDGLEVIIAANLESALKTICVRDCHDEGDRSETSDLWVDSLCINQTDVAERSAQVSMMAQIYSRASLVISWLGPSDADSEVAIPLMKRLRSMFDHGQVSGFMSDKRAVSGVAAQEIESIPLEDYTRLSRFLARKYFFRGWILQEVMLAKRLRMLCGEEEVEFGDMRNMALFVSHMKLIHGHYAIAQALSLPVRRGRGIKYVQCPRSEHNCSFFTFPQLLDLIRFTECGDPRDKIYSIVGMVRFDHDSIMPDYRKPTVRVYSEAVRRHIIDTGWLGILDWVTHKYARQFPYFPSWIGEFSVLVPYQQELSATFVTHNATLGSSALPEPRQNDDYRVLTVRGACIDQIAELADIFRSNNYHVHYDPCFIHLTLKLNERYHTGQSRVEALIRTLVGNEIGPFRLDQLDDLDAFKTEVREDICTAVIHHLHYLQYRVENHGEETGTDEQGKLGAQLAEELDADAVLNEIQTMHDSFGGGEWIPSIRDICEVSERICTCDAQLTLISEHEARPLPSRRGMNPISGCICSVGPMQMQIGQVDDTFVEKITGTFNMAIMQKMNERRLARTEKGYLALVPDDAVVGDAVWLLKGANVPFVLRRSAAANGSDERAANDENEVEHVKEQERWEIVGDSYVHGVMDGEVWGALDLEKALVDVHLV